METTNFTKQLFRTCTDHLYGVLDQTEDSARELVNVRPGDENRNAIENVLRRQYLMVEMIKHIIHYLVMTFSRSYEFTISYANAAQRNQSLSQAERDTLSQLESVGVFILLEILLKK